MAFKKLLMVALATVFLFGAVPGFAADVSELERRLDIVSDELDRMKSSGGSGGIAHRTSVHGYGESHWNMVEDDGAKVDHHRFVLGVHSEITDWIHLNMEMDFEHAMKTLEFEFAHLDFMVSDNLNFRGGTMLMPMGNLNEFHEPNLFYTAERPNFHKYLIPTSWQQAGGGIFGSSGDISYRLYLVNALQSLGDNGRLFELGEGVRGGRTDIKGIKVGDLAVTGRVEYKQPGGQAGFSLYTGNSTGGRINQGGNVTMIVADYKTKRGAFDVDLGVTKTWIEDTKEINAACGDGTNSSCSDVPQSLFGLLGTFAVHVPELMGNKTTHDVIAYVQYQKLRPYDKMEEGGLGAANHAKNYDVLAFGAAYMPHPKVALKATFGINYYDGEKGTNINPGKPGTTKSYFDLALGYQY